ncbi:hypothetical protein KC19_2G071600 [Ceratodon purpureus]|uniref:Uncharacterized protein n=1 Tax=Ceratodon purpureus TaxID=3225 RepID=A0A8T0ITS3_CERPU|nr:hypothetical protein KC19_2G071600 [Ceratodon purpureus]
MIVILSPSSHDIRHSVNISITSLRRSTGIWFLLQEIVLYRHTQTICHEIIATAADKNEVYVCLRSVWAQPSLGIEAKGRSFFASGFAVSMPMYWIHSWSLREPQQRHQTQGCVWDTQTSCGGLCSAEEIALSGDPETTSG